MEIAQGQRRAGCTVRQDNVINAVRAVDPDVVVDGRAALANELQRTGHLVARVPHDEMAPANILVPLDLELASLDEQVVETGGRVVRSCKAQRAIAILGQVLAGAAMNVTGDDQLRVLAGDVGIVVNGGGPPSCAQGHCSACNSTDIRRAIRGSGVGEVIAEGIRVARANPIGEGAGSIGAADAQIPGITEVHGKRPMILLEPAAVPTAGRHLGAALDAAAARARVVGAREIERSVVEPEIGVSRNIAGNDERVGAVVVPLTASRTH